MARASLANIEKLFHKIKSGHHSGQRLVRSHDFATSLIWRKSRKQRRLQAARSRRTVCHYQTSAVPIAERLGKHLASLRIYGGLSMAGSDACARYAVASKVIDVMKN
jgi:hypothetical protein